MVVTVFGLGFVGLTTALGFADKGIKVFGIDVDENRKNILKKGMLPFFEPDMDKVLLRAINKSFFITDDTALAIAESDCVYYCVGTPYGKSGEADLKYLFGAIDTTLSSIKDKKFRVLVTKSTIPPSTTLERIIPYIETRGITVGVDLGVANNPEFLREGHCWEDFTHADRIVLGCNDEKSEIMLRDLYSAFDIPILTVSCNTGEFIKYLSNSLLATMISYSNEMSFIAESIGGIDTASAFKILHMDKRWNGCNMTSYVYPGCGYGGYCLPKDTKALLAQSVAKGYNPLILKNVIDLNDGMPRKIAGRIAGGMRKDTKIGVLGLSFKPYSDDVRDTPSAKIIAELISMGYVNIYAYDPIAIKEFQRYYTMNIHYTHSLKEICEEADILAIITAWPEFKTLKTKGKKIIDCRYML